jgi:hypothetical protein
MKTFLLSLACWLGSLALLQAQTNTLTPYQGPKVFHSSVKTSSATPVQATKALTCDDDQTPPLLQCPNGSCLPDARVAYVISSAGEPWGQNNNIYAMDAVFGPGGWDYFLFENLDPSQLLTAQYRLIFLEGSNNGVSGLIDFLAQYQSMLEAWVHQGGALFINCAPNGFFGTIPMGFNGVHFEYTTEFGQVQALDLSAAVFQGPFLPVSDTYYGNSFQHGEIKGDFGTPLMGQPGNDHIALATKTWGNGLVYFGAMTIPYYHSPQPEADHLRQNILADLANHCNRPVTLPAAPGDCFTLLQDASLDATATDNCTLVSLTHDYAAPSSSSLTGATFGATPVLVTWTATDAAGNTASCAFQVLSSEDIPPVAICPDNVLVPQEASQCGAVVQFNIQASDNCDGPLHISSTPASGILFPVGSTTVHAVVSDASGNESGCSFEVQVSPQPEICNGLDDDCNGLVDDNAPGDLVVYLDADHDGYGNANQSIMVCVAPYGYVDNALDCDDNNYYVNPGAWEWCNGQDDNCDGQIDEGTAPTWFADVDGDGYGDINQPLNACDQPVGYVPNNMDCDDTNSYIRPGALEDCTNLTDENCDGILGDNNFTISILATDVHCAATPDGTVSISISPAQLYPVIQWNSGQCCNATELVQLDAGTYRVTVSNECGTTRTQSAYIAPSPNTPIEVSLSGTSNICSGAYDGAITASASGGCGNYLYEWSNYQSGETISGLSGGMYYLTVTDACGCSVQKGFYITEAYPLYAYFGYIIPLLDGTYFVQIVPYGGVAPFQFRRSDGQGGFTAWSANNGFFGLTAGDYVFEITDAAGCTYAMSLYLSALNLQAITPDNETETALGADRSTAIPELELPQTWLVFPNPGTDVCQVSGLDNNTEQVVLTTLEGRALQTERANAGNAEFHTSELPAGVYLVQTLEDGRVTSLGKWVKL